MKQKQRVDEIDDIAEDDARISSKSVVPSRISAEVEESSDTEECAP